MTGNNVILHKALGTIKFIINLFLFNINFFEPWQNREFENYKLLTFPACVGLVPDVKSTV